MPPKRKKVESIKKKKSKTKSDPIPPDFVLSVPTYVPSDSETDDSDDSDYDDSYEFSQEDFENPPFEIDTKKRGKIITKKSKLKKYSKSREFTKIPSAVVQPFLDQLHDEGYGKTKETSRPLVESHISVSFALNRPKSLSSGKNRALYRERLAETDSPIAHRRFMTFWAPHWQYKSAAKGRKTQPAALQEVHSFYKQLQELDPERARAFRRENENPKTGRTRMVPYRALREKGKEHKTLKKLVEAARKKHPKAPIYLSFVDADTKSFRIENASGIYSAYTAAYIHAHEKIKKPLEVMSTGYKFSENKMPLLEIGTILDMRVREATATFIPRGVYYPEPNFVVRIHDDEETVSASFLREGETDYTSPEESSILLKNNAEKIGDDPAIYFFSPKHSLWSRTPERAKRNKKGSPLQFSPVRKDKKGQFQGWEKQDLTNIVGNLAQSHAASRDWSKNLLHALSCKKSVIIDGISTDDGNLIRDMTISLLSRLFNSYDPLALTQSLTLSKKLDTYHKKLHHVLTDYEKIINESASITPHPSRSYPALSKKATKTQKDRRKKRVKLFKKIDALSSRRDIIRMLSELLEYENYYQIQRAARASGRAIAKTLIEFFSFTPKKEKTKSEKHHIKLKK